jgi:hypothetical protein
MVFKSDTSHWIRKARVASSFSFMGERASNTDTWASRRKAAAVTFKLEGKPPLEDSVYAAAGDGGCRRVS